jgi:hypothetical protein
MGDGEMPSEVIYGARGNVDVRVSWGNDESRTIQVVTQAAEREDAGDPTERVIGIVNEWLKAAGEPTLDLAKIRAAMPYQPSFDGWWALLEDWGSVNRLIKILQRARDRAFGSPA